MTLNFQLDDGNYIDWANKVISKNNLGIVEYAEKADFNDEENILVANIIAAKVEADYIAIAHVLKRYKGKISNDIGHSDAYITASIKNTRYKVTRKNFKILIGIGDALYKAFIEKNKMQDQIKTYSIGYFSENIDVLLSKIGQQKKSDVQQIELDLLPAHKTKANLFIEDASGKCHSFNNITDVEINFLKDLNAIFNLDLKAYKKEELL